MKRKAIAKCRRRIEAARNLYLDGDLTREDYVKRKEQNEREIAHWEARTTETEKVALELTLCLEAIEKINQLWQISEDEADALAVAICHAHYRQWHTKILTA